MAKAAPNAAPSALGPLRFLYVGSSDVGRDLKAYAAAGGQVVWDKTAFGTRVAAVRMGADPLILLAGHRPSPSLLPVFQVEDLKASTSERRVGPSRARCSRCPTGHAAWSRIPPATN
jgi:hypothetical protein